MITSINDYKLILEKAKKQKNNDLVLIDAESKINGSEEYLEKLFKYCKKYNRTFQFWNKQNSDIPKYDFPNQIKELEFPELTNIDISDIETLFYGEQKEAILANFQDGLISGIVLKELYKDVNGNSWAYLGHNDQKGDQWAIINSETDTFLNSLKNIERKVVLFGNPESVAIISLVLNAYNIINSPDVDFEPSLNPENNH